MAADNILILGIGNLLWADEGFGVRCVELMNERYQFPPQVKLLDGGTQGIYLIQHVQEADVLIVFDAIDYGLKPGTLKVVRDGEVPKFMGAKRMSLHQTGFQEVLAMAEFTGNYPRELMLIGVQPELLEDFGGSLTTAVRSQLDRSIALALEYMASLGVEPHESEAGSQMSVELSPQQLALERYEKGRPDADEAFRHGDIRFVNPASSAEES